jgi:hypothetical protein
MRRTSIGMLLLYTLAVAGCGAAATAASEPRPPAPVDMSVYVDNARVAISPRVIGAGPIVVIITNQTSRTLSVTIAPAGNGVLLARSGPIVPQATAQVSVEIGRPGLYTVAVASGGTQAQIAAAPVIQPASLRIGRVRPSAGDALLQP